MSHFLHPQLLPLNSNKGEHGFDNEAMDMKSFFRAVGPDFQKNLVVDPFDMVDVYPLMCNLLGIDPEVNDGHLDNTKHMLFPKKDTGDKVCKWAPILTVDHICMEFALL